MSEKNYYKILEIEKTADDEQIREAYKLLAKKYQQDENDLSDYVYKMKDINEACLVLTDDNDRAKYDEENVQDEIGIDNSKENSYLKRHIEIERDLESEKEVKINIESCIAFFTPYNHVQIIGEIVSKSNKTIKGGINLHILAYDIEGTLVSRQWGFFSEIKRRLSFEYYLLEENLVGVPAKIKIYFTLN